MITLLIIDMQVGSFELPPPQHDAERVISRINQLARAVRESGGAVIFIQHDGPPGDTYEPGSSNWQLLPQLEREPEDRLVNKQACDAFYETDLKALLGELGTTELWISGSDTAYCVDTTVRAAASLNYQLTVVKDAHTTSDSDYMDAATVKQHHNFVWENLSLPRARVRVAPTAELVEKMSHESHLASE